MVSVEIYFLTDNNATLLMTFKLCCNDKRLNYIIT